MNIMAMSALEVCWLLRFLSRPAVALVHGRDFLIIYPQYEEADHTVVSLYLTTYSTTTVNISGSGAAKINKQTRVVYDRSSTAQYEPTVVHIHPTTRFPYAGKGDCIRLHGEKEFFVTVVMCLGKGQSAAFKAIPVKSWGPVYSLVVQLYNPSIQVVAWEPCVVKVKFFSDETSFVFRYGGWDYDKNSTITVALTSMQSLSLTGHNSTSFYVNQIYGAKLTASRPVGVVTGNAYVQSINGYCLHYIPTRKISIHDLAAEMIPPTDLYGNTFVCANFDIASNLSFLLATAGDQDTTAIYFNGERTVTGHVKAYRTLRVNATTITLTATYPILLTYFVSTKCFDGDVYGGPSMGIVVPIAAYSTEYDFIAPGSWDSKALMQLILEDQFKNVAIYLDITRLSQGASQFQWRPHPAKHNVSIVSVEVSVDQLHTVGVAPKQRFACYVFGYSSQDSYLFFAGMRGLGGYEDYTPPPSPLTTEAAPPHRTMWTTEPTMPPTSTPFCVVTMETMSAGDKLDNDCDMVRDEEEHNGLDDDKDGLVDEDLAWEIIKGKVHCFSPEGCQQGYFGKHCDKLCRCQDGCRHTGNCSGCTFGFFGPDCQYVDVAHVSAVNFQNLSDHDDHTCVRVNMSSHIITVRFAYLRVFTWLRIVADHVADKVIKVLLGLGNGTTLVPCSERGQVTINSATVDIFCTPKVLVDSVYIYSLADGATRVCSVYVSAGRHVAIKQKTRMSSTYRDQSIGFIAWSDLAVDGELVGETRTFYAQPQSGDNDPFWEVTFRQPVVLYEILIHGSIPENTTAVTFAVELCNEASQVVERHSKNNTNGFGPRVYHFVVKSTELISRVRVDYEPDSDNITSCLRLIEFEALGECFLPTYGLDCSDVCSLTCVDQRCDYFGHCLSCPPGVTGSFCLNTIGSDETDDYGEDNDKMQRNFTDRTWSPMTHWYMEHGVYYTVVFTTIMFLCCCNERRPPREAIALSPPQRSVHRASLKSETTVTDAHMNTSSTASEMTMETAYDISSSVDTDVS